MHLIGSSPNTRCPRNEESLGTRGNWETGVFIKMLVLRVPCRVKQISQRGFIFLTSCSNAHLSRCQFLKEKKKRSHRSCSISLFCFFHCSLKSVENSCQTEKKVLRPTSFSPAFGFTEKDTVNSKKLRKEKKRTWGRLGEDTRDRGAFSVVMATDATHDCCCCSDADCQQFNSCLVL